MSLPSPWPPLARQRPESQEMTVDRWGDGPPWGQPCWVPQYLFTPRSHLPSYLIPSPLGSVPKEPCVWTFPAQTASFLASTPDGCGESSCSVPPMGAPPGPWLCLRWPFPVADCFHVSPLTGGLDLLSLQPTTHILHPRLCSVHANPLLKVTMAPHHLKK